MFGYTRPPHLTRCIAVQHHLNFNKSLGLHYHLSKLTTTRRQCSVPYQGHLQDPVLPTGRIHGGELRQHYLDTSSPFPLARGRRTTGTFSKNVAILTDPRPLLS